MECAAIFLMIQYIYLIQNSDWSDRIFEFQNSAKKYL